MHEMGLMDIDSHQIVSHPLQDWTVYTYSNTTKFEKKKKIQVFTHNLFVFNMISKLWSIIGALLKVFDV